MNSEFVGFPRRLWMVQPKQLLRVSTSPRSHATSMAWRMARSTRLAVVPFFLAISGYRRLVTALMYSGSFMVSRMASRRNWQPLMWAGTVSEQAINLSQNLSICWYSLERFIVLPVYLIPPIKATSLYGLYCSGWRFVSAVVCASFTCQNQNRLQQALQHINLSCRHFSLSKTKKLPKRLLERLTVL